MKKYLLIAKNMWDETVMYRLNFTMWRLRVVLSLLITYFLWLAILPSNTTLFGYSQSLIVTYILGTALLGNIVLASRSGAVGDEIKNGDLSNFLLRPINYFLYWFAKDLGDKAMNISFSLVELVILFIILRPPLFLQTNILVIFSAIIATVSAVFLYFFINFLIGLTGFWVYETWPLRFLFMILINFFAGGLFPLDILPKPLFTIFQFLPFTYLLYFPVKIYLGQLQFYDILKGLTVSVIWLLLLYQIVLLVWRKGLQVYTAHGR